MIRCVRTLTSRMPALHLMALKRVVPVAGVPYVLEIWPVGSGSPVHNHGGACAIIKVLHGSLTISLYNKLKQVCREDVDFALHSCSALACPAPCTHFSSNCTSFQVFIRR